MKSIFFNIKIDNIKFETQNQFMLASSIKPITVYRGNIIMYLYACNRFYNNFTTLIIPQDAIGNTHNQLTSMLFVILFTRVKAYLYEKNEKTLFPCFAPDP